MAYQLTLRALVFAALLHLVGSASAQNPGEQEPTLAPFQYDEEADRPEVIIDYDKEDEEKGWFEWFSPYDILVWLLSPILCPFVTVLEWLGVQQMQIDLAGGDIGYCLAIANYWLPIEEFFNALFTYFIVLGIFGFFRIVLKFIPGLG